MAAETMDEIVASCLVCGQKRKLSIWNESGSGVCSPCRYKAEANGVGYVLYKAAGKIGETEIPASVFRSHVYHTWNAAKKALDGIVWHSRDGWEIRPVMVGAMEAKS